MKTFSQLRESKKTPKGEAVFDSKIDGYKVVVKKEKDKFVAYIDNEKLDSFTSLEKAKKATQDFIKMAGGRK